MNITRIVKRNLANPRKTLEVGCGQRRYPQATYAIDKESNTECDIVADAHFLPFKENTFRNVVSFEVLEHLQNPSKALQEMKRVLTNDGQIVISVPNIYEWRRILSIHRHPLVINCPRTEHRQAWDIITFHQLAILTGLKITNIIWFDHTSRTNSRERFHFFDPLLRLILPPSLYYRHVKVNINKVN